MPTDTERREVARRLRHAWVNVPDTNRVRHHLRVLYEIYEAIGVSGDRRDAIDLFDRLADLIEPESERTCRVECYPPGYEDNLHYEVCSECGAILTAMRPGDRHSKRANYCPSCGARVEVNR